MKQHYLKTCLGLQLRRVRGRLWALLAMALVALLLSAAVALAGSVLLAGRGFGGLTLAVAAQDGDERLDQMAELLGGMREVAGYASVVQVPADEAEALVQSGQANAAVVLPAGFLDSVMTGENRSPTLLVDASRPLEMMLVVKLAHSATRLLTRTQQGIAYTLLVYDSLRPEAPPQSQVVRDINLRYATWVLGRDSLFRGYTVAATGALPVVPFYLLSGALFFMMLCLPVLYPVFSLTAQQGWLRRLRAAGCPLALNACAQILAGAVAVLPALCLLAGGAWLLAPGAQPPGWTVLPGLLLCALFLACFGFLVCNVGGALGSVSLNFLLATVFTVVYGGLVPLGLLPRAVAALAPTSPLGWMHDILAGLYGVKAGPRPFLLLGGGALALLLGGLLLARRREGRLAE